MNAWLIEKKNAHGLTCLGECDGVLRFTIPDLAIRYARREDAEAEARAHGLRNVEAVEHIWDSPKRWASAAQNPLRKDRL